jgi:hypothetical protein
MKRRMFAVGLAQAVLVVVGLASPVAAQTVTLVMDELDNPRGLAFGPEGALYVAEAGRGGDGPCVEVRGQLRCYGPTGALTRLWNGKQERVATGLPSYLNPDGTAIGPHDVSFQGLGGAFVTIGFGEDPAIRAAFGEAGASFGTLVQVAPSGQWRVVADVLVHEATANPDGDIINSNPYGILAEPGAHVITDAGANSLFRVEANGAISTLAVFPSRSAGRLTDAVPTEVVVGPDGAYYVSELTGVPFAAGAARVYRVVPGAAPEVVLEGFKTIIDLDFGPDGSLYVLQHATGPVFFPGPGEVIRVAPDGTRTVVAGGLTRPTSLLVGSDGAIYVSNRGASVGTGEVLHIAP